MQFRPALILLLAASTAAPALAADRHGYGDAPTVEIHLEALRDLRGHAQEQRALQAGVQPLVPVQQVVMQPMPPVEQPPAPVEQAEAPPSYAKAPEDRPVKVVRKQQEPVYARAPESKPVLVGGAGEETRGPRVVEVSPSPEAEEYVPPSSFAKASEDRPVAEAKVTEPEPAPKPEPVKEVAKPVPPPQPEPVFVEQVAKPESSFAKASEDRPQPEPVKLAAKPEPLPLPPPSFAEATEDRPAEEKPQLLSQMSDPAPVAKTEAPARKKFVNAEDVFAAESAPAAGQPVEAPVAAPAETPPQQVASLPPEVAPAANSSQPSVQIVFVTETDAGVPLEAKAPLATLAAQMKQDPNLRVSVVAHAAGTGDATSTARKVSLARALAVRAHLIDQGVDNLRINVQAEGSKNPGNAPNRVDLFLLSPAKG